MSKEFPDITLKVEFLGEELFISRMLDPLNLVPEEEQLNYMLDGMKEKMIGYMKRLRKEQEGS